MACWVFLRFNRNVFLLCNFILVVCCFLFYNTLPNKDFQQINRSCLTEKQIVWTANQIRKQSITGKTPIGTLLQKNISNLEKSTADDNLPIPVMVYYVWCQSQYFEFRHYLSVKSAIENIKPDTIILFYRYYPYIDSELYNTWLDELQQTFPFLQTVQAPTTACGDNGKPSVSFIYSLTKESKGIYLSENMILVRPLPITDHAIVIAIRSDAEDIDLFVTQKEISCKPDFDSGNVSVLECPLVSKMGNQSELPVCVVLDKTIFPKNIWYLEGGFGRLARSLFYGSPEVSRVTPSYEQLIPNIGHMIWFGGGRMDFLFFLGVLSLLHVAEVEKVYIHGDQPPSGFYWTLLKDNPRIIHMPRDKLHMVYGQTVKSYNHKSDVLRAELIYQHGGIYLDTDAVFVRKLEPEMRGYDAIGSYDWIDWNHPFPEIINLGVAIGKKGSEFFRLFRESLKWFRDDDFSWNGLRRPYHILERHPNLIRIDPRLQVICYQFLCHGTWWKDFQDESVHHLNRPIDWKKDAFVFHWTSPTPSAFYGYNHLLKSNGMFADIGKHILNRSGLMEFFNSKLLRYF